MQEKDAHHLKRDEKQEQFSQTSCLLRLLTHFMPILSLVFLHYDLDSILSAEREDLVELDPNQESRCDLGEGRLLVLMKYNCLAFHFTHSVRWKPASQHIFFTRPVPVNGMHRHLTWTKRRRVCLMVIFSLSLWRGVCGVCGVCAVCTSHADERGKSLHDIHFQYKRTSISQDCMVTILQNEFPLFFFIST